ncbi:hypothetical protein [Streptomyces apricus]|uniref:GAF domain-containing protein n=1 Tax=Streptomyces apricus TaxID=1828112 RepID=A0A5B0BDY4_9ACTN|nr:hypothetical protein [Streptomyces apricus]KAA0940240.1 hypothetical protein FGF04_10640 [Streptomyces apricus]
MSTRTGTGGTVVEREGIAAVLGDLRPRFGDTALIGGDPARCARVLGVDGIAVSLTTNPVGPGLGELIWYASDASARLEDLQYTQGQGPGPETAATCTAVMEPDLSRVAPDRWPMLLPDALDLGVRAVFAFPLHVGGRVPRHADIAARRPGRPGGFRRE